MRHVITVVVVLALGYFEAGMVVIFGTMIMLTLGFLMQDVQDQTKQLTEALKDHSELQGDESGKGLVDLHGTIDGLRHDLGVMAGALHSMHVELHAVRAVVTPNPRGPWET